MPLDTERRSLLARRIPRDEVQAAWREVLGELADRSLTGKGIRGHRSEGGDKYMALGMDWGLVEECFEERARLPSLLPTIEAMRRIVRVLEKDPSLADVQRGVSHVSLRLGYPGTGPFVLVGWTADAGYNVCTWDAKQDEVRDHDTVDEQDLPVVIHRLLRSLRESR